MRCRHQLHKPTPITITAKWCPPSSATKWFPSAAINGWSCLYGNYLQIFNGGAALTRITHHPYAFLLFCTCWYASSYGRNRPGEAVMPLWIMAEKTWTEWMVLKLWGWILRDKAIPFYRLRSKRRGIRLIDWVIVVCSGSQELRSP